MNEERRTDLPEWARYIAIDSDGSAWAFEHSPELRTAGHYTFWMRNTGNRCAPLLTEGGRLSDAATSRLVFPLAPVSPIPYETARERMDSEVEKHSITGRGTT